MVLKTMLQHRLLHEVYLPSRGTRSSAGHLFISEMPSDSLFVFCLASGMFASSYVIVARAMVVLQDRSVILVRPDNDFRYTDDTCYRGLLSGKLLQSMHFISAMHLDVVEGSLWCVFNEISVTFDANSSIGQIGESADTITRRYNGYDADGTWAFGPLSLRRHPHLHFVLSR
jgi:hypothetical protein